MNEKGSLNTKVSCQVESLYHYSPLGAECFTCATHAAGEIDVENLMKQVNTTQKINICRNYSQPYLNAGKTFYVLGFNEKYLGLFQKNKFLRKLN